jgi:hypothetical protein
MVLLRWYVLFAKVANLIDSSVRHAKPEQAITAAAYLLFYRRRSEMPLGGDTSKLIEEYANMPTPDDSDSSSTSPKMDDPAQSGSSSPRTEEVLPSKKPPYLPGFLERDSIAEMYAPLKSYQSASSWHGGWSNRAGSSASTPSVGFEFGSNSNHASGGSSSPGLDSENITPDDAGDADVESVDDTDKFEEVLPMDMSESVEEPEVINLEDIDLQAA